MVVSVTGFQYNTYVPDIMQNMSIPFHLIRHFFRAPPWFILLNHRIWSFRRHLFLSLRTKQMLCISNTIRKYGSQQNFEWFFYCTSYFLWQHQELKIYLLSFIKNPVLKSKHSYKPAFIIIQRIDKWCLNLIRD